MGAFCFLAFFTSGETTLILWAAVGIVAGIYLFFRGFRMLQRKRLIVNTPTSKIRSASMGLVEVGGLAAGPYTMTAPLCGLPCYYCRTIAWQWKQAGKNKEWVKIIDESLHLPFYLDDNTGRVLVDPQGAELDLHRDFQEEYRPPLFSDSDFLPGNVSDFLTRHGFLSDREKVKVEEYCIKPKNALFVLGTLTENPGLEVSSKPVRTISATGNGITLRVPGFSESPLQAALDAIPGMSQRDTRSTVTFTISTRNEPVQNMKTEVIRLSSDSSKPLSAGGMTQQEKIAAALTKAGITNPAAWAAAGLTQGGAVAVAETKEPGKAENFELRPKVVLMKGEHNSAFFISWRSQKDVVASLGWKSALLIWGGPALSLLCIYALATRFHLL